MGNQQVSQDFLPVPGLRGYFVDQSGDVWSTRRSEIPRKLSKYEHKVSHSNKPYFRVKADGRLHLVHRLCLAAYLGRSLLTTESVNHLSGDTLDNTPRNLEVSNHAAQVEHAVQTGLYCSGDAWYTARGLTRKS